MQITPQALPKIEVNVPAKANAKPADVADFKDIINDAINSKDQSLESAIKDIVDEITDPNEKKPSGENTQIPQVVDLATLLGNDPLMSLLMSQENALPVISGNLTDNVYMITGETKIGNTGVKPGAGSAFINGGAPLELRPITEGLGLQPAGQGVPILDLTGNKVTQDNALQSLLAKYPGLLSQKPNAQPVQNQAQAGNPEGQANHGEGQGLATKNEQAAQPLRLVQETGTKETKATTAQGETVNTETPEVLVPQELPKLDYKGKINFKVGDGAMMQSQNLPKDLAEEIAFKFNQNINEFQITLYPKELGEITVKILFQAGKSLVTLTCANPEVKQMLAGNAEGIRNIIENNTNTQTVVVVEDDKSYLHQQKEESSNKQQQQQEASDGKNQAKQVLDENDTRNFLNRLRLGMIAN